MEPIKGKLRELLRDRKIKISGASKALGIRRETLYRKIKGTQPFYLREAVILHEKYFSDLDFLEVFSEFTN